MIILASDNIDILSTWGAVLRGTHKISVAASLDELKSKLSGASADCVAFDRNLAPNGLIEAIKQIRKASAETRIMLLTDQEYQHSDQEDLALLRAGVRGFCSTDMSPEMIHKVLDAVDQGQVWVRSSFLPTLIEELSKQAKHNISVTPDALAGNDPKVPPGLKYEDPLSALTHREREIAALISQGECNKRIAQCLQISEQTVKAHLTVIFRKLNVTDRVHLALQLTHH
ncbi:MAG: response regulator transcription factor [Sulfuricellaceae bacterium]|nr:response regulator transcription factor [Sulfuricellaceae bacterium]